MIELTKAIIEPTKPMKAHAQYLHLYGNAKEIASVIALMPKGGYRVYANREFYRRRFKDRDTGQIWHTILEKQRFTDLEMKCVQAAQRLQPMTMYHLLDCQWELVHSLELERNTSEYRAIGDETAWFRAMYEHPAYWYSIDIRDSLGLAYASLTREPDYAAFCDETEVEREQLAAIACTSDDLENPLVPVAQYLSWRLEYIQKSLSHPQAQNEDTQRRIVAKAALNLALCALNGREIAYIADINRMVNHAEGA
jgi:hypothetical protein